MLVETLLAHAASTPREIAIHDDLGTHTYEELAVSAMALAAFLKANAKSQHVGLILPSGAAFVTSFYGTLLAGKSVVPINFLLGEKEIAHVIADSEIDLILSVGPLISRMKNLPIRTVDLMELKKSAPATGAVHPHPQCVSSQGPDDLAVLMYTSGTSASPKGVRLTFGNLQSDVDACIIHAQLQHKHVFLGVLPLFHAFGMTAMMLAPIQLGCRTVYLSRFSAMGTLTAIREHHVSLMFAVPSMYAAIGHLKNASAEDFKSIYMMLSGGEPLPEQVRVVYEQRFGVTIYEGYGLTETCAVVAINTPHGHSIGSVGRPIPGVEIRIVDDDQHPVAPGISGEIWLKGPMVTSGYHHLPEQTNNSITPDGYFKTGDLGILDADGYLHIVGRKKDLIIVAGEKVPPREIEEILIKHPSVAEAAVVGKRDPGRGEVPVAFIVAREGQSIEAQELRDFCRQEGLMQWKIPRELFVEKELPRSPTGKVIKRVLSERVNAGN